MVVLYRLVLLQILVFAALLATITPLAHAGNENEAASAIAAELGAAITKAAGEGKAQVLFTPLRAPQGDAPAAAFQKAIERELAALGSFNLIDRQSLKAVLNEAQLAGAMGVGDMTELAGGFGAQLVISGSIDRLGDDYAVNLKATSVEKGEVIGTARAGFTPDGEAPSVEATTLRAQLRRLADRIAGGLDKLEGDRRYQRYAVLPFEEIGETTKAKELGLLIAAELTTLLSRDHGLMMVERTELSKVIDEMALGQSGLVAEEQSVEAGKLAGAQALVMGSVSEAGDIYLANAKVVSCNEGKLILAEEVALPAADLVALSSEAVVLRSRSGAIYRSLLLPGWGQVYNRQPIKGAIFVGLEVLAGGAAGAFHYIGAGKERDYNNQSPETVPLKEEAEQNYVYRNYAIGVLLALHAVNVIDAILNGKSYDSASVSVGAGSAGVLISW